LNQPNNAINVAVTVVPNNNSRPTAVVTQPNSNVTCNEIWPVTVGLDLVLSITGSISTSYQLFNIHPPAMTKALPSIVRIKTSQFALKLEPERCKANQNPVKTVIKFELIIPTLIKDLKSCFIEATWVLET